MSAKTPLPSKDGPTGETIDCPPDDAREYIQIIHYGGRHFVATRTMAEIFLAHAEDIIDRNETSLVPLLHKQGVDLLLVGPTSAISISQIDIGISRPEHRIRPARTGSCEEIAG
jgi:hypothetical protein